MSITIQNDISVLRIICALLRSVTLVNSHVRLRTFFSLATRHLAFSFSYVVFHCSPMLVTSLLRSVTLFFIACHRSSLPPFVRPRRSSLFGCSPTLVTSLVRLATPFFIAHQCCLSSASTSASASASAFDSDGHDSCM